MIERVISPSRPKDISQAEIALALDFPEEKDVSDFDCMRTVFIEEGITISEDEEGEYRSVEKQRTKLLIFEEPQERARYMNNLRDKAKSDDFDFRIIGRMAL